MQMNFLLRITHGRHKHTKELIGFLRICTWKLSQKTSLNVLCHRFQEIKAERIFKKDSHEWSSKGSLKAHTYFVVITKT